MSEFKEWWKHHSIELFGPITQADAEKLYLAGQASADLRVKELEQERDEAVRQWERFERMAGDNWAALKAQAGEPIYQIKTEYEWVDCPKSHYDARASHQRRIVYLNPTTERETLLDAHARQVERECAEDEPVGYHFSYTTPFGHVVWGIDYTPRPDAIEVYPLIRAHPTTERPYNPLNDYAVIPMAPTEPVKAQAGEPVAWMNKRGDVISAEEKTLIIENGKLGYPGGEFDLHAKNIERSYTIPLGVINV